MTAPSPPPVRKHVWQNRHRPHHVYELYDAEGEPVYVGFTINLADRLRTHQSSEMWREVAEVHTQLHPTRADAQIEEERLIRNLQPRWTMQHTERASEAARERWRERKARLAQA